MSTTSNLDSSEPSSKPILLGFPKSPKNTRLRVLVDRSLTPAVAVGLNRFDEIHAVHLRDIYSDAQKVPDAQWLADAGANDWIGVTQDAKIPSLTDNVVAILHTKAQVYALSKADWPPITQGLVVGRNLLRFFRNANKEDPGFWRISERSPIRDI